MTDNSKSGPSNDCARSAIISLSGRRIHVARISVSGSGLDWSVLSAEFRATAGQERHDGLGAAVENEVRAWNDE